jgi:hypothetical protein
MHSEEVMNPGNNANYNNQARQNNEKPFYYLYQLDFFSSFFHRLKFIFLIHNID